MSRRGAWVTWAPAVAMLCFLAAGGCSPDAPAPPEPPTLDNLEDVDPAVAALVREKLEGVHQAPEHAGAWAELAMAYDANAFDEPAVECYREAVARRPGEARWWHHLGRVLERQDRFDEAVTAMERVVELGTGGVAPHLLLAQWHLSRGLPEAARAAGLAARAADPKDPGGDLVLAQVALAQDAAAQAVTILEDVIRRAPHLGYAHTLLGRALLAAGGDRQEALIALARGRGFSPPSADPWAGDLRPYRPGYAYQLEFAYQALDSGNPRRAAAILEPLSEARPGEPQVLVPLGRAYVTGGVPDRAVELLLPVVASHPSNLFARLNLADAYLQSGRLDEAEETVRKATDGDHASSAKAWEILGHVLARGNRIEEALEAFGEASTADPKSAEPLVFCGLLLSDAGRYEEALASFDAALEADPASARAYGGKAAALVGANRPDEAQALLEFAFRQKFDNERMLNFAAEELRRAREN